MYLIASFVFFCMGGVMALVMRLELFMPGMQILETKEQFNQLFTMHGTLMLLMFGTPVFVGFANVIVPLQIGAPDVAFPRLNAFAFPLWTFTVAAGAIWAQYAWGRFWNWDPKETWSFVTWVIYAAYLHARATAGWKGSPAAIIAIIGVVSFWFNFVGVNLLFSGLHSYAGI